MSASAFSSPATGAGKDDTPTQSVSATSATDDGGDDTAAQSMSPPGPVAPLGMCRGFKLDFWCSRCGSNWTDDLIANPTLWCMLCGDEEGAYKDMVLFQYGQSARILKAAAALPPAAPLAGAAATPLAAPAPVAAAAPHAAPPATPAPAAAVAPHATPPEDAMLMVGENFTREGQEVFDDDGEVYVLT